MINIKRLKKYIDLPYLFILFGLFIIVIEFILMDYSNLSFSSFDNVISGFLLILTMIFVLKVIRK